MKNKKIKEPTPLLSIIPVIVLVITLFFTIRLFGSDALEGGSQIVLLFASAVCCTIALVYSKIKWNVIETSIMDNVRGVAPALFILLIIGALAGSWMISGIVPSFIYYGIKIIHPKFFLLTACIICSIVSVITGSSWTTIATIGVALLGVGQAQGIPIGWVAGAIISGGYFGDKISPLSDTTILASSVAETPLFKHIRYLMGTTVPSMIITLIIFTIAGFNFTVITDLQIDVYTILLKETFNITPWLFLVPLVTGIMIFKRVPTLVTLFLSAIMAAVFGIIFQPNVISEIAGNGSVGIAAQFKGMLITLFGSTTICTGNPEMDELLCTRGMAGMLNTVWLILCAVCFGGTMMASGMLKSLTSVMLRFMKKTVGVVASTVISGLFFNVATADQYISIIVTGKMFSASYKEKGYESRLLSRTIEDAVTVTSPLVPWNTCGMTQATILGVSTFVYFPYCFFNLLSPLMSIVVAATGWGIKKEKNK